MSLSHPTIIERFWKKIDRRGPTECWPWLGAKLRFEYGSFHHSRERGKLMAHRLAWELKHGPIPFGLKRGAAAHVLHSCDNPPCCNPTHLFLGTHADNMEDMRVKGRAIGHRGEDHGCAILNNKSVLIIRSLAGKFSFAAIADVYGVHESTIALIIKRKSWRHI